MGSSINLKRNGSIMIASVQEVINSSPMLIKGLLITISLIIASSSISILLALILDLTCFKAKLRTRSIIYFTCTIITSIPEIIVLFITYFGTLCLLKDIFGHYISFSPFAAAVVAISAIYTSYLVPVLYGARKMISKEIKQSSISLGLNEWQQYHLIIYPIMKHHAKPAISNLLQGIIKDTALIGLIGAQDFLNAIHINALNTPYTFTFYLLACMVFLMLTQLSEYLFGQYISTNNENNYGQ
jgi:polar amino acid transport system permease protein